MLNPLAAIIQQIRHAVIDPSAPSAAAAAGARRGCSYPPRSIFGIVALGFWYFNREAPRMAEEL